MDDAREQLLAKVQPFVQNGVRVVWLQTAFGLVSVRAHDDRPLRDWEIGSVHASSGVTLGQLEGVLG